MAEVPHPHARLVHSLPCRTRLRVEARRGDHKWFGQLAESLKRMDGVHKVDCNAATGSVVVHHAADTDVEDLRSHAAEAGFLALIGGEETAPLALELSERWHRADLRLRALSGGTMDVSSLAFVALAGAGIVQLMRGQIIGAPAIHLFWAAAQVLFMAHAAETQRTLTRTFAPAANEET